MKTLNSKKFQEALNDLHSEKIAKIAPQRNSAYQHGKKIKRKIEKETSGLMVK